MLVGLACYRQFCLHQVIGVFISLKGDALQSRRVLHCVHQHGLGLPISIPVKSTDLVGSLPILDMSTDLPIGFSI